MSAISRHRVAVGFVWLPTLFSCWFLASPLSFEYLSETEILAVSGGCTKNGIEDCDTGSLLTCDQTAHCELWSEEVQDPENEEEVEIVSSYQCWPNTWGYTVDQEEFNNCVDSGYTESPEGFESMSPRKTENGNHVWEICYRSQLCGDTCGDPDSVGIVYCQAGEQVADCPIEDTGGCRRYVQDCKHTSNACEPST